MVPCKRGHVHFQGGYLIILASTGIRYLKRFWRGRRRLAEKSDGSLANKKTGVVADSTGFFFEKSLSNPCIKSYDLEKSYPINSNSNPREKSQHLCPNVWIFSRSEGDLIQKFLVFLGLGVVPEWRLRTNTKTKELGLVIAMKSQNVKETPALSFIKWWDLTSNRLEKSRAMRSNRSLACSFFWKKRIECWNYMRFPSALREAGHGQQVKTIKSIRSRQVKQRQIASICRCE